MKALGRFLLQLLLLPLFVLLIAPLGLLVRMLVDPMQLRRSARPSMLHFTGNCHAPQISDVAATPTNI